MATVVIKLCKKNTCAVFIYSINEFHLIKILCCTSIMLVQHNTSILSYYSITYKSTLYLILIGNLAHFCLVINLARRNSYSLHRLFNTPANISIPLLEIPNLVASSRHSFMVPITSEIIFFAAFRLSI